MSDIKKAKCCGTCKHWKGDWTEDYGADCEMIRKETLIIEKCDNHEWSEDE